MCFNETISLTLFILGTFISLLLYFSDKNPKTTIISILLFLVASMQLVEYFIWKNFDAQIFVIIVLFLQIIIPLLMFLYYIKRTFIVYFLLFLNIIIWGISFYYISTDNNNKELSKVNVDSKSCKLEWNYLVYIYEKNYELYIALNVIYILSFIVLFYILNRYDIILLALTILIISLIYTHDANYNCVNGNDNKNNFISIYGSIYCFLLIVVLGIISLQKLIFN